MFIHSRGSYQAGRLCKFDKHFPKQKKTRTLAGEILKFALGAHPGWAELLSRIGSTCLRRNALYAHSVFFAWSRDDTPALEHRCRSALFRFPGKPYFRRMLAIFIASQRKPERALAILGREELSKEPSHILALRARLHQQRGELEKAGRIARLAMERFPQAPWPWQVLAATLLAEERQEDAARVATEAMAKFPASGHFPALLSTIALRMGDDTKALQHYISRLKEDPLNTWAMQCLIPLLHTTADRNSGAMARLDAYEELAKTVPANYGILRRIAIFNDREPDSAAIEKVALAEHVDQDAVFDSLLARADLGDFAAAAQNIGQLLAAGQWDPRLIAYLNIYGDETRSFLAENGLPGPEFLDKKLKSIALGAATRESNRYRSGTIVNRVLETDYPGLESISVSIICPIHRSRDVQNLMAQLHKQSWRRAQVVFCLSNPEIREHDLAIESAKGYTQRIIRCEPGLPVGCYLNRCIDEATGELVLRFDADDHYAPDYIRYMVAYMEETCADVISMDLCSFYFSDINQTYLKRRFIPPSTAESGSEYRGNMGSGSSLCARSEVFRQLRFNETLLTNEDKNFYSNAACLGLSVRIVPGFFHTAVRYSDQTAHTWKLDDFNMLTKSVCFLGDGCIIPQPAGLTDSVRRGDAFTDLFADTSLSWMRELEVESILRSMPRPLLLKIGADTPIDERDSSLLTVTRNMPGAKHVGKMVIVFMPKDPEGEKSTARHLGGYSLVQDIIPELVLGNRVVFSQLGAYKPPEHRILKRRLARTKTKYAVLCNPRAGSRYLCSLLDSVCMGTPGELLREPVATVLARSSSVGDYLVNIFARQVEGDIFGTKIVSQYLYDHLDDNRILEIFQWMTKASFRFVRLRRPEYDTAVSAYIAEQRGIWHHLERPDVHFSKDPKLAGQNFPPYDFEAISREMEKHARWSKKLDKMTGSIMPRGRVLDLDYHDISTDPLAAVKQVAEFIDFKLLPGAIPVSATRPISTDLPKLKAYRKRFEKEWECSK